MKELTNSEKYSPLYGFEAGVICEYSNHQNETQTGYFIGTKEFGNLGLKVEFSAFKESGGFYLVVDSTQIKSIRILSGPWAVWQFAPSNAEVCVIHSSGLDFFDNEDWSEINVELVGNGEVLYRPWWSERKES